MNSTLGSLPSRRDSLSVKMDPFTIPEAKYQTIDEVRIIPGKMIFKDAYDGKTFNQAFTIINCGKYTAFVRVLPPSSNAFKMKAVPRGQKVSAGMSITRNISYTHNSAMALPQASILVYINEKRLLYQIEIHLNAPFVNLNPKIIDFGDTDVGTVSQKKSFKLINRGHKVTQFSMDLGRADVELIVQPMKGTIEPNETIEIYVEVMGHTLGQFGKEFWIKTDPPQRIKLTGVFIQPKLVIEHPLSTFKLSLIDFPKTYFGAETSKTMVIKNSSSTSRMFCVVLQMKSGLMSIETAMKIDHDLKCFSINPKEGRLGAQQRYILRFSFSPKKSKKFKKLSYRNYNMVFIRIANVHYRDRTSADDKLKNDRGPITELDQNVAESLQSLSNFIDEEPSYKDYLNVCLYGEMEEAVVKLTPESFSITYLKLNDTYSYELNIKNMSKYLPITFHYNKVASVEVEPKQMHLGPDGSVEVSVIIRPTRLGPVEVNITFDLIYEGEEERYNVGMATVPLRYSSSKSCPAIQPKFNWGITPEPANEVGYLVNNISFNAPIEKPVHAIINRNSKSFDKSLRPWKNKTQCRTIHTKLPRLVHGKDEYTLNAAERDMKRYTKQYYVDYIRAGARRRKKVAPLKQHYDIGQEKRILLEGMYFGNCNSKSANEIPIRGTHLALCPQKLMNIKITPTYVDLGKIAPYTVVTESFYIQNNNDFDVLISIKSFSQSMTLKAKERMVIKSRTTRQTYYDCYSHGTGKYNVPVYIIVNQSHIFDAYISAKVVPTTVVCPIDDIVINWNTRKYYFQIYNPVNCDITFKWEVQDKNFEIFPVSGKVNSRNSLYCRICFHPRANAFYKTEMYLISQSGAKQLITVCCENPKAEIGFHTYLVKFDDISLNMAVSRELILHNFSETKISYTVLNPNPLSEVFVTPSAGKIPPKSNLILNITAHFKDIVEFHFVINFLIQNEYYHYVNVEGNVAFPCISIVPEYIQIHKIVSRAYQRRVFRVTNKSKAEISLQFSLADFPELFIADIKRNIIKDPISLQPNESRDLFLEFKPTEPVVYSIYLPYILNGIIGPPALNDPRSIYPGSYFNTTNNDNKTAIELPETIPSVGVRCAAGAAWVRFSSLELNFSYNSENEKYFSVRNICSSENRLTIRFPETHCQFHFHVEKAKDIDINEICIDACIDPGDEVVFRIEFKPDDFGTYRVEIPLFVNRAIEPNPFNHLKLIGVYLKPDIVCNRNILYYQTVPSGEQTSAKVHLTFKSHEESCHFESEVLDRALTVSFTDKITKCQDTYEVIAVITFNSEEEGYIESQITFKCTCGASYKLTVKASASNSRFESYERYAKKIAASKSIPFESTFPFFPKPSDDTFYARKMRLIKKGLEESLYTQRFFYKYFLQIPKGLCTVPYEIPAKGKDTRSSDKQKQLLPLLQLLVNLTIPDVVKSVDDGTIQCAFEGVEGTIYMYTTYTNILSLLKTYKIVVTQLEPEYLLPYKLYLIYKNVICKNDEDNEASNILSEDDYYYFTAQCWIDLLLRIHKAFIFDRILGCHDISPKKCHRLQDVYHMEFMKYFFQHGDGFVANSKNEIKLLLWIEFHFEQQKSILWDLENYTHLKTRHTLRTFNCNIWGGLGFATIIVAYCPYLRDDLKNLYPKIDRDEQLFHNSCIIYDIVKKLNLSYILLPPNLIFPTPGQMLLTMCYLYDIMPGFYPIKTITLKASLGETIQQEIVVKNDDNFVIAFTVIFFLNESQEFSADTNLLIIPPRKDKVLKITYFAKSVLKKKSVLVLSGETSGYKPAKSITFNLCGIPNIFDFSDELKFTVDTFVLQSRVIEVCSPFEKPYEAKIYFYLGSQADVPETLDSFYPISSLYAQNVPKEFSIDSICNFDSTGTTKLNLTSCYVSAGESSYFLYFLNEDIGDFSIKIQITSRMSKNNFVNIDVVLPLYFSTAISCKCNKVEYPMCKCESLNYECSKLIAIDIPYRNNELIDALRLLFRISVQENEYNFWNSLLDYPKGFHILRNYLKYLFDESLLPFNSVLSPTVTYHVEFDKSKINYPKTIKIDNVILDGTFKFPIHWNRAEAPEEETFMLISDHGQEIRQYRLKFKPYHSAMYSPASENTSSV